MSNDVDMRRLATTLRAANRELQERAAKITLLLVIIGAVNAVTMGWLGAVVAAVPISAVANVGAWWWARRWDRRKFGDDLDGGRIR